MVSNAQTFKLIVVGDKSVGKSTFIRRFFSGTEPKTIPKVAKVTHAEFTTNLKRRIDLDLWDSIGQESSGKLNDEFYANSQCAIIMFDVTCKSSYENVGKWYNEITKACPGIPIVLVGNKIDTEVQDRKVRPYDIDFHLKNGLEYYDISAIANFHIEKPYSWLLQKLTGSTTECILDKMPVVKPPAKDVDPDLEFQYKKELETAKKSTPLQQ